MDEIEYTDSANFMSKSLKEKCEQFLAALHITADERSRLDANTREQRNCLLWQTERKKRLTAAVFGKICKSRMATSKTAVVKELLQETNINTPATQHGVNSETTAIDLYQKKN